MIALIAAAARVTGSAFWERTGSSCCRDHFSKLFVLLDQGRAVFDCHQVVEVLLDSHH